MSDIKNKLDFLVTSHKKLTGSALTYEIAKSYIDLFSRVKDKKTLMISGSQGSGKSTLSLQIKKYFKKYYSKNVVILSIDDFYLSSHQRKLLAKRHNTNLFETRGVPGTHNLKLLNQTIRNLKSNKFPLFLLLYSTDSRCLSAIRFLSTSASPLNSPMTKGAIIFIAFVSISPSSVFT